MVHGSRKPRRVVPAGRFHVLINSTNNTHNTMETKHNHKDCVTRFCEWLFRCRQNRAKLEQERRERAAEAALLQILDLSREATLLAAKFMLAGQQVKMIGAGAGADWASREAKAILKDCLLVLDDLISVFDRNSWGPVPGADEPEKPSVANAFEWSLAVEEHALRVLHTSAIVQEDIFFTRNCVEDEIEILKDLRSKAIGWL